ncbi:MAG TPA: YciI family protein [Longimicrobiales bacterium]|nr:YciI family protein [Longimicrobiales bacterium]
MKFLCLSYGAEEDWRELPATEQQTLLAQDDALRQRGDVVAAVGEPTRVSAWNGTPCVERGPFSQATLPLAGFSLIEADDLDEALEIMAATPCARARGVVEVWPVRS